MRISYLHRVAAPGRGCWPRPATARHAARCRTGRAVYLVLAGSLLSSGALGCHELAGTAPLPAGTQDPSFYNNAAGALGMRNAALYYFGQALPSYLVSTGLLTDELTDQSTLFATAGNQAVNGGQVIDPLDERILPELVYGTSGAYASDGTYNKLQGVRTALQQAIGQLAVVDTLKDTVALKPAVARALRGELYALYGYTEIMLADFFCSGIPLSTIDFQKDFTYKAGSSTEAVYRDAIGKLDTALVLAADSVRLVNLARVGLGRAYLDLAYRNPAYLAAAADDVSGVPTDYQYQIAGDWDTGPCNSVTPLICNQINDNGLVADREGGTGQPYVTSGDPRTADTLIKWVESINSENVELATFTVGLPRVYTAILACGNCHRYVPVTVASGVEARLIEAEAALRAGDPGWLTILNTLRTSGAVASTYTRQCQNGIQDAAGNVVQVGSPCPAGVADTTWSPGTGFGLIPPSEVADAGPVCPTALAPGSPCADTVWYKGLRLLTDPGVGSANPDSARLALVFQERAYWLYLTGHRQGDLRRQLRQYHQYWPNQSRVYPTGPYAGLGVGTYGFDVTAPIPAAEYLNPHFQGCIDRAP